MKRSDWSKSDHESYLVLGGTLLLLLVLTLYPAASHGLETMSEESMSNVAGRKGLAMDLNLQASLQSVHIADNDGYSGGAGNGVLRIGDGSSNITIDDGSGNPAALMGLTLDATGSGAGNVVAGLPTGSLNANFPDVVMVSQFSSSSGSTSFGDFSVSDLNPGGSDLLISGLNEGIQLNVDGSDPIHLGTLQWADPDGTTGTEGTAGLGNFRIHDTEYSGWHFNGFEFHADGHDGLVFSVAETGNEDDMGITTDLMTNGSTIFTAKIGGGDGGIVPRGSEVRFEATGDGLNITPILNISNINRTRLIDSDGFGSSGGSDLRSEGIQAGAVFGVSGVDPANLGTHTVNFDASSGIVLEAPGRGTTTDPLDIAVPAPTVEGTDPTLDIDISNIDWRGSRLGVLPGGSNGDGIGLNLKLYLTMNEIRFRDNDGFGAGNGGYLSIGYRGTGEGITLNDGAGNAASLTGMTLDVNPNQGVVLGMPDGASNFGNVTGVVDKVTLGDASTEVGSFDARNMNFQGSKFILGTH